MRKIIIRALREGGFEDGECLEASDGVAALECLSKEGVDLVLSDINMPNMDGIEFVRAVRGMTTAENRAFGDKVVLRKVANSVPIVMITTEGALQKAQEALAAGANDYLKKPFTSEQLAEKIRALLR
jgi:two-component system chemotaxis response regulator CheY